MIKMPVIQDIRQMHRDGMSIAEISRKANVSEPTVRKYVRMEDLSPKVPAKRRVPSMLDDYAPLIDKWLEEDRRNWHKQRHTAQRVFERLVAEHGFEGSYSTVQRYVKRYREEHKGSASQYLDQDWPPGEMQVDFGQADFRIVGVRTRMHDLVCAFPFSNVGLAQVFYGETAECVCEGLIAVFEHIRGVAKRIFQILSRLIRHIRQHAERSHIHKVIVIKPSDITGKRHSVCNQPGCLLHLLRYSETVRKIIRTSGRNVSKHSFLSAAHQSGHHFIQRPVSAAADNQIKLLCPFFYRLATIHLPLGGINRHIISFFR